MTYSTSLPPGDLEAGPHLTQISLEYKAMDEQKTNIHSDQEAANNPEGRRKILSKLGTESLQYNRNTSVQDGDTKLLDNTPPPAVSTELIITIVVGPALCRGKREQQQIFCSLK